MDTNTETIDSSNDQTSEVVDTTTNNDTDTQEKKESSPYEKELYNELQLAKKKIQKLESAPKAPPTAPSNQALSQTELLAVLKAGVEPEDLGEISDYAKLKGISVTEALKTTVVKTILSEKKQERDTANATAVKGSARGSAQLNDTALLAMASKGEMPESDADIARLVALRKANK